MCLGLAVACGDDGGGPVVDQVGPLVVEVTPVDGAAGVERVPQVTVRFSEPVDPASVTPGTFRLTDGTPATATVDGAVATLVPDAPLLRDTVYTAAVTTRITDLAGNPLREGREWTFTVRPRRYATPVILGPSTTAPTDEPALVADTSPAGDVVAVWNARTDGDLDLYGARWDAGAGVWDDGALIETGSGDAVAPVVAVTPAGDAVVVWRQGAGLRTTRWRAATGAWEIEATLPTPMCEDLYGFELAAGVEDGDVVDVVYLCNTAETSVMVVARRYDVAADVWTPEVRIDASTVFQQPRDLRLAVGANGRAMALWRLGDAVFASRYDGGWGAEAQVAGLPALNGPAEPRAAYDVALHGNGNAIVLAGHVEETTSREEIWALGWDDNAGAWLAPARLWDVPASYSLEPRLASNGRDVIAVWHHWAGMIDALAASFSATSGAWTAPATIAAGFGPMVAIDAEGRAVALTEDSGSIVAAHRDGAGSWEPSVLVGEAPGGRRRAPAVTRDGEAVAVYECATGICGSVSE